MTEITSDFFESFDFSKNLVICWPVGVGKTYIAKKLMEKYNSESIKYEISDAKFKKYIASGLMNHRKPDEWQCSIQMYPLETLIRSSLVLYDDIWVSDVTDAYIRDLTYILDERSIKKLPTIFTTNLTEKELKEKLNERIVSRVLHNATVIVMRWEDRRRSSTEIVTYSTQKHA